MAQRTVDSEKPTLAEAVERGITQRIGNSAISGGAAGAVTTYQTVFP